MEVREISLNNIIVPAHLLRSNETMSNIAELSSSITERGVLQPIGVRHAPDGLFELVFGERRRRASIAAGYNKIPAIIQEGNDTDFLVLALIENLQREDLHPLEEAEGLLRLKLKSSTATAVAKLVGKNARLVQESIQLVNLPESIKQEALAQRVSVSKSQLLMVLRQPSETLQRAVWDRIKTGDVTLRETRTIVKREQRAAGNKRAYHRNPTVSDIEHSIKTETESDTPEDILAKMAIQQSQELRRTLKQLKPSLSLSPTLRRVMRKELSALWLAVNAKKRWLDRHT